MCAHLAPPLRPFERKIDSFARLADRLESCQRGTQNLELSTPVVRLTEWAAQGIPDSREPRRCPGY